MRNDLSNTCTRLMYGNVRKPKKKFKTDEEAIRACMEINSQDKQISKVTAYLCDTCSSYHIGKTPKKLTESDKQDAKDWLKYY